MESPCTGEAFFPSLSGIEQEGGADEKLVPKNDEALSTEEKLAIVDKPAVTAEVDLRRHLLTRGPGSRGTSSSKRSSQKTPEQLHKERILRKQVFGRLKSSSSMSDISRRALADNGGGLFDLTSVRETTSQLTPIPASPATPLEPGVQAAFSEGQLSALGVKEGRDRTLSIGREVNGHAGSLKISQEDLESRFVSLTAAFKTDTLTMNRRVELHRRQRDSLEDSTKGEIKGMFSKLDNLMMEPLGKNARDTVVDLRKQMDVLDKFVTKVASKAESYGAVQQEEKLGQSVDILMMYVESLKRMYVKETTLHEQTRQKLEQARVWGPINNAPNGKGEAVNVNITRRSSLSGKSFEQTGSRRASLTLSALPNFMASDGQLDIKQLTNSLPATRNGNDDVDGRLSSSENDERKLRPLLRSASMDGDTMSSKMVLPLGMILSSTEEDESGVSSDVGSSSINFTATADETSGAEQKTVASGFCSAAAPGTPSVVHHTKLAKANSAPNDITDSALTEDVASGRKNVVLANRVWTAGRARHCGSSEVPVEEGSHPNKPLNRPQARPILEPSTWEKGKPLVHKQIRSSPEAVRRRPSKASECENYNSTGSLLHAPCDRRLPRIHLNGATAGVNPDSVSNSPSAKIRPTLNGDGKSGIATVSRASFDFTEAVEQFLGDHNAAVTKVIRMLLVGFAMIFLHTCLGNSDNQ